MRLHELFCTILALLLFGGGGRTQTGIRPAALSQLGSQGSARRLIVNGKPMLILGGELGNSSASSLSYMRPLWPKFRAMHLNSLLIPVYWDLMEPEEGRFDYGLVDSLLGNCRRNGLHAILLWFGSWKNSMSCYVPGWIKTNSSRWPRAQDRHGKSLEILSAFSRSNLDADSKAFSSLMRHLKQSDGSGTVIMVQVENEIGMLTEARERTAAADSAFEGEVPQELMNYLIERKDSLVPELREHWSTTGFAVKGNWETVFGKSLSTDELFQAWYYAKYANAVAVAGKKEYPLPMCVNAALNYRNAEPGQYPSAGPLPHLMDIWQAGAPAIDLLSPDFYNPAFKQYCDLYTRRGNSLLIPEIRLEPSDAAKVFYAVGHYQALGFSPFSIESVQDPASDPIGKSYALLASMAAEILKYQGTGRMEGVLLDSSGSKQDIVLGQYVLSVAHDYTLGWSPEAGKPHWPTAGALIIREGADEFLIAGTGVVITFAVNGSTGTQEGERRGTHAGILQAEEGQFIGGTWQAGRRMNGDQDHQGRHIRIPVGEWSIQRVRLYQYK
ncbi:MAG: DUF5597 domain-containing protein [Bacteroidota bacterium]|nr:DUF5597 domain-containing protein [Bacteroidota bacterium]MDP4216098.1 DUF5597 domain-containing protein [Bacteroidota bacterium]MDP4245282.1 DUF5597 domain-containing protein [Bacteroidota bacterium]MDP4253061.1 DUF5597 domain-containing protein [Bacteroidota bacterium]MDP4260208.1 DUF5597 domain-containing protein [Bacteroidota bacterium]